MKYKIFLFSIIFFIFPLFSNAQNPLNIPFGGKILWTTPCTCSDGWYILMYDNTTMMPKALVFQFGISRLNSNYNMFSNGVNIIGSNQIGGTCMIYSGNSCFSLPVDGMITPWTGPGMGTSKI
jgi:hypothetical protein